MSLMPAETFLSGVGVAFVAGIGATILGASVAIISKLLLVLTGTAFVMFCLKHLHGPAE